MSGAIRSITTRAGETDPTCVEEWGNGIEDSTFGGDLYACVDPD
jgi:hypothetical protein